LPYPLKQLQSYSCESREGTLPSSITRVEPPIIFKNILLYLRYSKRKRYTVRVIKLGRLISFMDQ
jgi:hypothetical protein